MYDTTPDDDLSNLENEFEKISKKFVDSFALINDFSPFLSEGDEKNMENSKQNQERIKFEKINDYELNRQNFEKNIQNYSTEIDEIFNNISNLINSLKSREEFNKNENILEQELIQLQEINNNKIKNINQKVENIKGYITKLENDNKIDEEINRHKENGLDLDFN